MTEFNLLPCPFCGPRTGEGESVVLLECREGNFVRGYTARCDACGIEVNGEYESEVAEQWNKRTPVTPVLTIGDLNGTSPPPSAPEAASADSLIATAGNPLARIDGAGGEWLPRMWDLALAATDSEEHDTAAALKMVAASHGYLVNWVRQEVPDELADDGSREILSAVGAPADAPVEGLLIGRAVDEDGIINWYASPVDGVSRAVAGVPVALREPQPQPAAALVEALVAAEAALACCYNVVDYPATGQTRQDQALRKVRLAIRAHQEASDAREQATVRDEFDALKEEGNGNV